MKRTTCVIIPVYNEGPVIEQTISDILKICPFVVCVDDGSSDDSAARIVKAGAILVRHPINMGQGAALQTGLDYALQFPETEYFVTFDADGQHNTKDVETMLAVIKREKVDIVLGSRFLGDTDNLKLTKRLTLKLAVVFSNASSGLKLTDTHNGLRVFTRRTATKLQLKMPDFAHASEIIERIAEKKLTYKEVPVTIVYTEYSLSKGQSINNAINIVFDILLRKLIKS